MPIDHELRTVARNLARSAEVGASQAGAHLLGASGGPDAGRVRRSAFVQYVRDNWADATFRADLLARLVPAIPNPYAALPDGADAQIPARNGVAAAEALLNEAFPAGWPSPAGGQNGSGVELAGAGGTTGLGGFTPDPFALGGAG